MREIGLCEEVMTVRVAYADPPYLGCAGLYKKENPNAAEVNHPLLIRHLIDEYPDGWALSLHEPSLPDILDMLRAAGLKRSDYRIMPWVKPFASFKPGVTIAYAWEPVIVRGGASGHANSRPSVIGSQPTSPCRRVSPVRNHRSSATGCSRC